MNKRLRLLLLQALLHGAACGVIQAGDAACFPFESPTPGPAWTTTPEGSASTSATRSKQGRRSLRWQWRAPDDRLICRTRERLLGPRSQMGMWVYNGAPHGQRRMRVQFSHRGKYIAECWYYLNYRGWRVLGVNYARDLGLDGSRIDQMRILPPEGAATGQLFFDYVSLAEADGVLHADYQQPWAGKPDLLKAPETCFYTNSDLSVNRPWIEPLRTRDAVTDEEWEGMKILRERLAPAQPGPSKTANRRKYKTRTASISPGELSQIRRWYAEFNIRREGDAVTGEPLLVDPLRRGFHSPAYRAPPSSSEELEGEMKLSSEVKRASANPRFLGPDKGNYFRFIQCVEQIAAVYRKARLPEIRDELLDMYLDCCDYFLDQGYSADAVNMGDILTSPKIKASMARSILTEELRATGRLEEFVTAFVFSTRGKKIFAEHPHASPPTTRALLGTLRVLVTELPDGPVKLQYIYLFRRFVEKALPRTLLPDGGMIYHGCHHVSYADINVSHYVNFCSFFRGTCFLPNLPVLPGLHRYFVWKAWATPFPTLVQARASLGTKRGVGGFDGILNCLRALNGSYDPELGGYHLSYSDHLRTVETRTAGGRGKSDRIKKSLKLADELQAQGLVRRRPEGHFCLNSGSAAYHRRPGWCVALSGGHGFFTTYEDYGREASYIRYSKHGAILVYADDPGPEGLSAFGHPARVDGYNWSHIPGTTSPRRKSYELMRWGIQGGANPYQVGGGTSQGKNGVWGLQMKHMQRSVFCFDDRITSLTSGIRSEDGAAMSTTVYQYCMDADDDPVWVNGARETSFPFEETVERGENTQWLIDRNGTGYLIHPGNDPLQVYKRCQEWTLMRTAYLKDPASGAIEKIAAAPKAPGGKCAADFARTMEAAFTPTSRNYHLAYFDHGASKDDASCAYTIIPDATPEEMAVISQSMNSQDAPPYKVLHMVRDVHALFDRASRTYGYVWFSGGPGTHVPMARTPRAGIGPLMLVDRVCVVMVKEDGQGGLACSLDTSDPTDDCYAGLKPTSQAPFALTFKGMWMPSEDSQECRVLARSEGMTTIELTKRNGSLPAHFSLVPAD